ncbi:MAG: hypothetical protein R3D63_00055 [Paracoccaceae bacterium]
MIRPEAMARLRRWSEPATGAVLLAIGLWVASRGGWLLALAGGGLAAMGAGWLVLGLRRMRFAAGTEAPGLVELDEGRITYLGPQMGGSISLPDLIEIRLLSLRGRRAWRLRQADGQVLQVPLDAAGAGVLFDAFSALPGLGSAALVAALDGPAATGTSLPAGNSADRLVWRRQGRGLTRA